MPVAQLEQKRRPNSDFWKNDCINIKIFEFSERQTMAIIFWDSGIKVNIIDPISICIKFWQLVVELLCRKAEVQKNTFGTPSVNFHWYSFSYKMTLTRKISFFRKKFWEKFLGKIFCEKWNFLGKMRENWKISSKSQKNDKKCGYQKNKKFHFFGKNFWMISQFFFWLRIRNPKIRNPKIRNPNSGILFRNPKIRNPKIRNPFRGSQTFCLFVI